MTGRRPEYVDSRILAQGEGREGNILIICMFFMNTNYFTYYCTIQDLSHHHISVYHLHTIEGHGHDRSKLQLCHYLGNQ